MSSFSPKTNTTLFTFIDRIHETYGLPAITSTSLVAELKNVPKRIKIVLLSLLPNVKATVYVSLKDERATRQVFDYETIKRVFESLNIQLKHCRKVLLVSIEDRLSL